MRSPAPAPEELNRLWCEGDWKGLLPPTLAACREAKRSGDREREAELRFSVAFLRGELGERKAAIADARRALKLNQALGKEPEIGYSLDLLAGLLDASGRPAAALRAWHEALEFRRLVGNGLEALVCQASIGDLLMRCGRLEAARQAFEASLSFADDADGYPGWGCARVQETLSLMAECRGDLMEARRWQEQCAASLYTDREQVIHQARAHWRLGELEARLGRLWPAREVLQHALSLYTTVGPERSLEAEGVRIRLRALKPRTKAWKLLPPRRGAERTRGN